jgi:hypothetical protein
VWAKDPCWETCQYHATSYRAVDEYEHVLIYAPLGANPRIDRGRLSAAEWSQWGSRGVWALPSVRANDQHPAMFPPELAARLVRLLTPPGGVVLDPFVGSGTVALAALAEGRKAIGIERHPPYADIARRRVRDAMGTGLLAGVG